MNELSKKLMCIQMRSQVELWLEAEKSEKLQEILQTITGSKFVRFEGRTINTADIVGIFTALDMEELTRRKNGEWKCQYNFWHPRKEDCEHVNPKEKDALKFIYE
jgi:Mg2+/Co2+ transporter CorC